MEFNNSTGFGQGDVNIVEKKTVYSGFFKMLRYRLKHRLMEGGWSHEIVRECLNREPAVAVLLYDPYKDCVVLVEQFRVGVVDAPEGPWQLELVAGIVEAGESIEAVAHREAIEEAGCEILAMEYVFEYYPSPGGSNEKLYLFCGGVDSTDVGGVHGLAEEGEDIKVQVFSRQEAWNILQDNYIHNASTIIALQWLQVNYQRLQDQWQ